MKKMLLVQFRDDISEQHECACVSKFMPKTVQMDTTNALHNRVPVKPLKDKKYSAVILGASGQYDMSKNQTQITEATKKFKGLYEFFGR